MQVILKLLKGGFPHPRITHADYVLMTLDVIVVRKVPDSFW